MDGDDGVHHEGRVFQFAHMMLGIFLVFSFSLATRILGFIHTLGKVHFETNAISETELSKVFFSAMSLKHPHRGGVFGCGVL